MREDYQEALEKMFPDGFVIYYTCPNETVRIAFFNPLGLSQIIEVYDCLIENFKEEGLS